jgi:formate dehydrogenase subunit gamma
MQLTAEREQTVSAQSWVLRFTRTERLAHWVQAAAFLTLMGTGLILGLNTLATLVGNRALVREIHLWSAFLLVFGPSLISLAGNRLAVSRTVRQIDEWTPGDLRWLLRPSVDPHTDTPPQGRFNAGQKLNALFTAYSTVAFAGTGLILWQNRRFPFDVVSQAHTIHTTLTYLALAVFLGHLYLAALHPATRQSLHGMVFGTVRRTWADRHHPLWHYADGQEATLRRATLGWSFLLLTAASASALFLVRWGLEWLGANTTDEVTVTIYRLSSLPGTLAHPATGAHSFDPGALAWAALFAGIWFALSRRNAP